MTATVVVRGGVRVPLDFFLSGTLFFVATVAVVSAIVAALLAVPYAFAVVRRPARRFWGENAPLGRVLLYVAICFIPIGIAFGLTPRHTFTTVTGSFAGPSPSAPSR